MQYLKTNWHPTPNQTKPNQTRFDDTMIPNWYRKTSYRDIRTANKFNYQSNPKAKTIWTHLNRYLLESLGSHWEAQVSNGEPSIGDKLLTSPTSPTSHVASPRIFRPPLSEQKSRFFIVFFFLLFESQERPRKKKRLGDIEGLTSFSHNPPNQ